MRLLCCVRRVRVRHGECPRLPRGRLWSSALGDDLPKYLNSPETPIYTKSNILYHLDRAKEALRQRDFAVLFEGYMDAIAVARA